MKKLIKLLALLMCVVIMGGLFPATAIADWEIEPEEEYIVTGEAVEEAVFENELEAVGTTIDVPDIDPASLTEGSVYAAMLAKMNDFPEGMLWTNDNYYDWYGGIYMRGYGCMGFAFILSDAAFGKLPARMTAVNYGQLRTGDILRVDHDAHSVIVLEVHPEYVVIAEGNYNASIHWGRVLSRSQVEAADYVLTRWPDAGNQQNPNTYSIIVRIDPFVLRYDQEFTVTATVTDSEGQPVSGQLVYFAVLDEQGQLLTTRLLYGYDVYGVYTWTNGEASLTGTFVKEERRIEPGKYLIYAEIHGSDNYSAMWFELVDDEPTTERVPGDVNGDGQVTGTDLIRLRKYLAGEDVVINLSNADVTGDGTVSGTDLIRLRKYLAGDNVQLQ